MKTRKMKKLLKKQQVLVVSFPDWNGGCYYGVMPSDYKPEEFEYTEWEGTLGALLKSNIQFTEHWEPFHEEPQEWTFNGRALALRWMREQLG